MEKFLGLYMKNLILAKNKFPAQYQWPESDILEVFRRMVESFKAGTYSRHGHAVKWTCKEMGIPNTREAIDQIFREGDSK
jgi:hypothetical protein